MNKKVMDATGIFALPPGRAAETTIVLWAVTSHFRKRECSMSGAGWQLVFSGRQGRF